MADAYTIQIKPQDELTLVIDKIINSQAERVYLLVPENSRIAQHALNFRLLKREADALGKEIIVVSANPRIQTLALKSAIQVHHETEDFKRRTMRTGYGDEKPPVMKDIVSPPTSYGMKSKKENGSGDLKSTPSFLNMKLSFFNAGKDKGGKVLGQEAVLSEEIHKSIIQTQRKPVSSGNGFNAAKKVNFLPKPKTQKLLSPKQKITKADKSGYITEKDLKITGLVDRKYQVLEGKFVSKKSRALKVSLVLLILISCFAAAFTFYSILPSAKVLIVPSSEVVELNIAIKGDTSISEVDIDGYKVPAQIFEKSIGLSKTVQSSGEKEIIQKAAGKIKIYNSFSSDPQTLVKTTRFMSEDGKLFRTTETVIVPGAKVEEGEILPSFTYVNVESAEAGEEYNVGPSTFSIPGFKGTPKYLAFYGKSEENMTGGKIARVKVVSGDDYNKSKTQMEGELKDAAGNSLASLVPEDFIIPSEAHEIGEPEVSVSHEIGDETASFTLEGKVLVRTFAVMESDIMSLIKKDFESRFPDMKLQENGDVLYSVKSKYFKDGILEMASSLVGKAVSEIDINDIREKVKGKSETEFRRSLAMYKGVEEARVTLWPFWVNSIPDDIGRIEVVVE